MGDFMFGLIMGACCALFFAITYCGSDRKTIDAATAVCISANSELFSINLRGTFVCANGLKGDVP